jgi:inhibitor of KinA sporulation pathway (predicted exonuclease)
MHVVSLDLEMAQPSRKIIEIGYTIFNPKNKEIKVRKSIFVNPHEQLSQEIMDLTGITQEEVDNGVELTEAYNIMCADVNRLQCFKNVMEWSTDHIELRNQLGITWADYIFELRSLDVKSLFQMYTMTTPNTKTVAGLSKALGILGLEFEGRPHRAENDAYNTVRAFWAITDKMRKFDFMKKIYDQA